MELANVFSSDLFSSVSLTVAINEIPYQPGYLTKSGLFEEDGIMTPTAVIEKRGSVLQVLPTAARGAPGTPILGDKRTAFPFKVPHIPAAGAIWPDEVQNVREFGTGGLLDIQKRRDEKLAIMSADLDLTLEAHRVGCIQGKVLDTDGSTIFDMFAEFGFAERSEVDFNLDATYDPNNPTIAGAIRQKATAVLREMQDDLGGIEPKGALALCSDAFWDDFIRAPEIRSTYINQQAANNYREFDGREEVVFAGIKWVNYRGVGTIVIDADKVRFVPLGVPGLFITRFAPPDWIEAVNTKGAPKHVKAVPDPAGRFIELLGQSNPLNLCTRPRVLRKGKRT